jgi:hypothetical protein
MGRGAWNMFVRGRGFLVEVGRVAVEGSNCAAVFGVGKGGEGEVPVNRAAQLQYQTLFCAVSARVRELHRHSHVRSPHVLSHQKSKHQTNQHPSI